MGHFSKFVRPGAVRISSGDLDSVESAAFWNPDGSKVLVVHNKRTTTLSLAVNTDPDHHFERTDLQAGEIATFQW